MVFVLIPKIACSLVLKFGLRVPSSAASVQACILETVNYQQRWGGGGGSGGHAPSPRKSGTEQWVGVCGVGSKPSCNNRSTHGGEGGGGAQFLWTVLEQSGRGAGAVPVTHHICVSPISYGLIGIRGTQIHSKYQIREGRGGGGA